MKTNKLFGLVVLACGFALSFTSCSSDDNQVLGQHQATISFENKYLNSDGYWMGDKSGEVFDNWGEEGYACVYKENGVSIPVNYTPAWASWSGFAISSRTETTFKSLMPDQFNNITGKAKSGEKFGVVYPYGESIEFGKPVTLKGFWYTNASYTVDAFVNGDGMTPGKFEASDWFLCKVTATKADGTTKDIEIYLAKDGDYVKDWQLCDFNELAEVTSLSFSFDGTRKNDYGLTTPAYLCIDDIEFEY